MAGTRRPQNRCRSCGYTWYPRGKNISLKCPNCGHTGVSRVWGGSLLSVVVVGLAILGGGKKEGAPAPAAQPIAAEAPAEAVADAPAQGETILAADGTVLNPPPLHEEVAGDPMAVTPDPSAPAPMPVVPASYTASFDCSRAATAVDTLVCQDPKLAEADLKLAELYASALTLAPDVGALAGAQDAWRKDVRDACSSASCLQLAYEQRIGQLSQYAAAR